MVERPVGSGIWRLRVYVGRDPASGNPIQKQRTFKGSERAAGKALAKFVTEMTDESALDSDKSTVDEILEKWLEHREAIGKVRPKSAYEYRRKIEYRISPELGKTRITALTPKMLDNFYAECLTNKLSPSTVRIYHSILSAALGQAVKWNLLRENPAAKASPPTAKSPTMKVPTPAQLSLLVQTAEKEDPVLAAAIALAALTGARRGELVALRWSDIDLEEGSVQIARGVTVVNKVAIEGPTKTHQARRVALDDIGIETLRRHWLFVARRSQEAASPLVDDPYVLSYQAHSGIRVNGDTLTHRFGSLCERVERKALEEAKKAGRNPAPDDRFPFHFHELRHFSVTTLLAAGVDVRTVAERHGHAQATMTLNRYAHALPERDRVAAGILGRALTSA